MQPAEGSPARDKVLFQLKTRGPQTAGQIGRRLGVTEVAIRQHLKRLEEEGLVQATDERRGVGRPSRVFSLTDKSHGRFPNTHADLTVELLAAVKSTFGAEGLDRIIAQRTSAQLAAHRARMPAAGAPLEERVQALARLRREEGYMAECHRERDGGFLLVENHCPICAAARVCQGFCRDELEVFRKLLGRDATIERVEHLLDGARRCAYRIRAV
jgi:predicted ArsR family transcriptional regulator